MNESAKPSDEAADRAAANRRRPQFGIVEPSTEPIEVGTRLESSDYGPGTVVAFYGAGVQVYWDKALVGTVDQHLLAHDLSYLERCRRL